MTLYQCVALQAMRWQRTGLGVVPSMSHEAHHDPHWWLLGALLQFASWTTLVPGLGPVRAMGCELWRRQNLCSKSFERQLEHCPLTPSALSLRRSDSICCHTGRPISSQQLLGPGFLAINRHLQVCCFCSLPLCSASPGSLAGHLLPNIHAVIALPS